MYTNRQEAGRRLAGQLAPTAGEDVVVLGLPRGGVPVAFEVAAVLGAPLDVIVVRKLGVPFQPELAMGAIGEDGVRVDNPEVIDLAGISEAQVAEVERRERAELERRAGRFRRARVRLDLTGRTALIVDDGIATGSTARAACRVARAHGADRVVLAAPVGPPDVDQRFAGEVDEVVVTETPDWFHAVGQAYVDFAPTSDDEVVDLLARAADPGGTAEPVAGGAGIEARHRDEDVDIPAGGVTLEGRLIRPEVESPVVVFAHGSGSSRHSPRNRLVASVLNDAGLGTLLFDLLSPVEELDRTNVFDIDLLAGRLVDVTTWLRGRLGERGPAIGYFGASTGAAAALWAAGHPGADVAAVVSRGGRPDLAGPRLGAVTAPTLLVVGDRDTAVLALNRDAQTHLRCESELALVAGATHLFEESGTLQRVAELASDWFVRHLGPTDLGPA